MSLSENMIYVTHPTETLRSLGIREECVFSNCTVPSSVSVNYIKLLAVRFNLFICLLMLILSDLLMDERNVNISHSDYVLLSPSFTVMCFSAAAVVLPSAYILETVKQYTVLISNILCALKSNL